MDVISTRPSRAKRRVRSSSNDHHQHHDTSPSRRLVAPPLHFGQGEGRRGVLIVRDLLVFLIIVLIAVAFIEGIFIFNYNPPVTQTVTQTMVNSLSITLTSFSTITYNSTVVSSYTATQTTTATLTSISDYTTSVTTTQTSTTTQTTTQTATATSVGPVIDILLGSSTIKTNPGFAPSTLVVVIGVNNTVTWLNSDTAHHTVTSTSAVQPFNSGDMAPGQTYTFTFTVPGTYSYVCAYHTWMKATVKVL